MTRALLPFSLLLASAMLAHGQEQEQGMVERIEARGRMALQAQDVNAKANPALTSPLASKSYSGRDFSTKSFSTGSYGATKSAELKTFATKSFLGIKNPWFGKTVFETSANREASRTAREASEQYKTGAFAVNSYAKAGKKDLLDAGEVLPDSTKPRPYLVAPKAPGVMDRFSENLQEDLTIDDVRELLNKGAKR